MAKTVFTRCLTANPWEVLSAFMKLTTVPASVSIVSGPWAFVGETNGATTQTVTSHCCLTWITSFQPIVNPNDVS